MHEIEVCGEIHPSEFYGFGGFTLRDLKEALTEAGGADVRLYINSKGGDLNEGFAIYSRLRKYAKEHDAKIETITDGECASTATVIFLSGDTRKLNRYIEPFVHNAWTYAVGDNNELLRRAEELERVNSKLAKFYADNTELSESEARELMESGTYITAEEALAMRFCTELDEIIRPEALKRFENKKNIEMSDKNLKFTKEHESLLNKFVNFVNGKSIKNLMIYTSTNEEMEFPNIESESDIEVGLEAIVDGDKATGSYVMKSGETYVFEDGKLTEIKEAENEEVLALKEELTKVMEERDSIKNSLEELKEEFSSVKNKLSSATDLIEKNKTILNKLREISIDEAPNEAGAPPTDEPKKSRFSLALNRIK